MSLLSHFSQQRKQADGSQQRANLKAKQNTQQQQATPKPQVSLPLPSKSALDVSSLARAARVGTFGWEDLSDGEVLLRKFDMELTFGPCTGLSRMERWQRAVAMGMKPPAYVPALLQQVETQADAARHGARADVPQYDRNGVGSYSEFHRNSMGMAPCT